MIFIHKSIKDCNSISLFWFSIPYTFVGGRFLPAWVSWSSYWPSAVKSDFSSKLFKAVGFNYHGWPALAYSHKRLNKNVASERHRYKRSVRKRRNGIRDQVLCSDSLSRCWNTCPIHPSMAVASRALAPAAKYKGSTPTIPTVKGQPRNMWSNQAVS